MANRRELMHQINAVSFMVDDIKLYLDTHPDDMDALESFREYSQMRNHSLREYAKMYGPLTVDCVVDSCVDSWNWICEPWPWQEGGC